MSGFRMCGRTVEVFHYQVTYTEKQPNENDELTDVTITANCATLEEAQAVAEQTAGAVTSLDSSAYDWMDGLQVPDVPDTYTEAVKIYEQGQDVYLQQVDLRQRSQTEQIRADLDYIMLMEGL